MYLCNACATYMKYTTIISFLVAVLLLAGCYSDNKYISQLDAAEGLLGTAPDSALALLQEIDSRRLSRADNALYALLLSQARDKCYIDETNDSLINIAVEYYKKDGNIRYRGMAYYYLSRVYENAGNYENALQYSLQAEEALLRTDDYNMLALVYANRADIYQEQYRYKDAIKLKLKAIGYYSKCNNPRNMVYAHLSISRYYTVFNETDSALSQIEQARHIAQELNNSEILYDVENYLASFYEYNNEPIKALNTLQAAIEQYPEHSPNTDDYLLLCRIYYNTGRCDSALYYLDNYYAPLCQTASDHKTLNLFRSRIYESLYDYENAYKTLHQYQYITTNSGLLEQEKSIPELEKKYQTQILQHKNRALNTRNTALCIISVLIIIIALLFALLYVKQRRLRIAQYEQFSEQLSQSISTMQQRIEDIKQQQLNKQSVEKAVYTDTLNKRIEALQDILELINTNESHPEQCYRKIRSYYSLCSDNKVAFTEEIRLLASLHCPNIVAILQEQYPTLSDEEVNLCCMTVLGFEPNHIRILYNHTHTHSIYSKRTRLRKKLSIEGNEDIKDFLENLASRYK